jgi:long-chain acyl-CoA synthetase
MKHNKKKVFLTGATGLVGSYLLKILLQEGHKVYVLARSKDNKDARTRVTEVLKFWDKNVLSRKARNLVVLDGDITKKNLGLDKQKTDLLINEVEEIYHCAAITNYNWKFKDIRKVNVLGTKRILDFAMQCRKEREFKKVNYVSSAYICGNYTGIFREDDLYVGQQFNTSYEQSKFEAEKLIHIYRNRGLWVDIFRPSIVIGESQTGNIPVIKQHFYQVLRIWTLGIFDYFPGKDYFANMVPIDELSRSIIIISSNISVKNRNYHLFSSQKISLNKVFNIFTKLFGVKKTKTVFLKQIPKIDFTPAQALIIKNLLHTFNGYAQLNSEMTEKILGKYGFTFSKIDEKLFYKTFKYLRDINYFKNNKLLN